MDSHSWQLMPGVKTTEPEAETPLRKCWRCRKKAEPMEERRADRAVGPAAISSSEKGRSRSNCVQGERIQRASMKCRIVPRDMQKVEAVAQGARKLEGNCPTHEMQNKA